MLVVDVGRGRVSTTGARDGCRAEDDDNLKALLAAQTALCGAETRLGR